MIANCFPYRLVADSLSLKDFELLSLPFSQVVQGNVPTSSRIFFASVDTDLSNYIDDAELSLEIKIKLSSALDSSAPVAVSGCCFIFPLSGKCNVPVAAVVSSVDEFVWRKADRNWLIEVCDRLPGQLLNCKNQYLDLDSGLPNRHHLQLCLSAFGDNRQGNFVLVQVQADRNSKFSSPASLKMLAAIVGHYAPVNYPGHHLGQGLFALIFPEQSCDEILRLGAAIVIQLKSEKIFRVHVGSSSLGLSDCKVSHILDRAWQALLVAGKRGPFSFCAYETLLNPEKHPLFPGSEKVRQQLCRLWKNVPRFTLLKIRPDNVQDQYDYRQIENMMADPTLVKANNGEFFVFYPDVDADLAVNCANKLKNTLASQVGDCTFSIGLTCYPGRNLSKAECFNSCQKALKHAEFYGPASVVMFDAVSLNVSGDIYYAEGDLAQAVKEYREGLLLEPDNVNLLNSLGVAYGMMNRQAVANTCFVKALSVDKDNFMALYNLAIGEKTLGNFKQAGQFLELAMSVWPKDSTGETAKQDAQLQLGILCCKNNHFQKGYDILRTWSKENKMKMAGGNVFWYLGLASYHTGHLKETERWLHKALRVNELDARVLSLLGIVYMELDEGDEIALSFCEKSVELMPGSPIFRMRLAKVQAKCGQYVNALKNLTPALRKHKTRNVARYEKGMILQAMGRQSQADKWFLKVVKP